MTTLAGLTTDDVLVLFDDANPAATKFVPITGVTGNLLGIDLRPANGLLYGVSTANEIYTIDPANGAASLVSTLSEPFLASAISGVDFNPAADRLRLVGDNNQDFRINVDTGAVTIDGNLAFATGDANVTQDANITAAAYTNAFAGTTSTQLYNIDGLLDVLTLQNPPNNGIQQTIGALGVNFEAIAGFDIVSATPGENRPFAVSNSMLYSIDLGSGTATAIGEIGSGNLSFKGLTQAPAVPVPRFSIDTQAFALTDGNTLISFNLDRPDVVTETPLTGLDGTLLGIDVRPATGELYGITTAGRIYTIEPGHTGSGTFGGASTLSEAEETELRNNAIYLNLHSTTYNGGELRGQINVTAENDIVEPSIALEESQQVGATVPPADGPGIGAIFVIYDDATNTLAIKGSFNNLTGSLLPVGGADSFGNPESAIHIHNGAAGANGPIIRNLTVVGSNRFEGTFTLSDAEEAELFNDALYVNLHTTTFNGGELRGQIDVTLENDIVVRNVLIEESQQVGSSAPPANGPASGNFDISFDNATGRLVAEGQFANLTGSLFPIGGADSAGNPESAVHFHNNVAGANGPIVRNLSAVETNTSLSSTLSQPFDGGSISGFDFNPVADRLRLVSDTDTNFRINVETGSVTVDGDLAFATADTASASNPSITASGYTNSFAGTTSTQLYNLDGLLDTLTLQNPPNDGVQQTIGNLGVDLDATAGFDIIRSSSGENVGFAASNGMLYTIDLVTGQAFEIGEIGGDRDNYTGLTIVPGNGRFNGRLDGGGSGFDAKQYLASHRDLISAFGLDTEAAADHFNNSGQAENRATDNFDELRYLASYPDLITAFGTDTDAAIEHFINSEIDEGRTDQLFDPVVYVNTFSDLRRAFGTDFVAATRHYIQTGFAEGRTF
ncbi:MAG: DUF4394 domain-containing protein [Coleofasciculaceae cyanobacterium RL_1_1]|nr:DUF4394 domain-containing protein [Coleofasciculaceae cyanobacterium RL_1_1]